MIPRSQKYLHWISTLPCIITGRKPCAPHHQWERYKKMLGKKCSDYRAVPLCVDSHTLYHDVLGWRLYEINGIDIEAVIKILNSRWENETSEIPNTDDRS